MTNPSSSDNLFANIAAQTENQEGSASETQEATTVAPPTASATIENNEGDAPKVTELEMLKNRARIMGIQFSNNIGIDSLRARINERMESDSKDAVKVEETDPKADPKADTTITDLQAASVKLANVQAAKIQPAKPKSLRDTLHSKHMRLVRVRITNMDPKKKDLPGEIFTVANRVLGTVKKFIPYGEATDNGYHIPYFIYKQLLERTFLDIKVTKDSHGREVVKRRDVREFALELLPDLTQKELAALAAQQAAAAGMD